MERYLADSINVILLIIAVFITSWYFSVLDYVEIYSIAMFVLVCLFFGRCVYIDKLRKDVEAVEAIVTLIEKNFFSQKVVVFSYQYDGVNYHQKINGLKVEVGDKVKIRVDPKKPERITLEEEI